jgi:hypothetical protein
MLRTVRITPTITAGIYAAADAVGQRMSVSLPFKSLGKVGFLRSLVVFDKGNVKANLLFHLFRDTFTAAADNAAFGATDAEAVAKGLGLINIATADYVSNGTVYAVATKTGLNIPITFPIHKGTLYCQLQAVATPTYTSISDLTLVLAFEEALGAG